MATSGMVDVRDLSPLSPHMKIEKARVGSRAFFVSS